MSVSPRTSRLLTYGLLLVGVFITGYALAQRFASSEATPHQHSSGPTDTGMSGMDMGSGTSATSATAHGVTLVVDGFSATDLSFHLERAGEPVTDFVDAHGALLHLVLVRHDLSGFQHLHPTMTSGGTWSGAADLGEPGAWRVIVEARPADLDSPIALGTDVTAPGMSMEVALPAPADQVTSDGMTVARHGMHFTVEPVDDLEPFLGQAGHLIAIRSGDLAYMHLHPDDDTLGSVMFSGALPSGTWRLWFQFQRAGHVVTTPFTVVVP